MHRSSSVHYLAAAAVIVLANACTSPATQGVAAATSPDSALLKRDVSILADDSLEGRGTGTRGNDAAAAFIARRYESLHLTPVVVRANAATCAANSASEGCEPGFIQPFVARSISAAHAGKPSEFQTQNVIGVIPGTDPQLRNEYVLIGAHFDHLGRSSEGALDPDKPNAIHNGADDNASGTAVVMELARLFKQHPARRSIAVLNFSGEEWGLLGSQYMVEHSPWPNDKVQAMLNFDMVGRLRDDKLLVYGVATATELPAILDSANVETRFKVAGIGDGFGPSDHSSFFGKNIPVLHFFTDVHEDYHKASDKADRINAGGMARVARFAERVARNLADRPARLTFVRPQATATTRGSREGTNVYLGSVPDMGATDVKGLKLSGVRPGSPADQAGMIAGDIIVEFAGKPVKDLYEYSDALFAQKPGDVVKVVVMRGSERKELTVTLGKRGG